MSGLFNWKDAALTGPAESTSDRAFRDAASAIARKHIQFQLNSLLDRLGLRSETNNNREEDRMGTVNGGIGSNAGLTGYTQSVSSCEVISNASREAAALAVIDLVLEHEDGEISTVCFENYEAFTEAELVGAARDLVRKGLLAETVKRTDVLDLEVMAWVSTEAFWDRFQRVVPSIGDPVRIEQCEECGKDVVEVER